MTDAIRFRLETTRADFEDEEKALEGEMVVEGVQPFQADATGLDRSHFVETIAVVVVASVAVIAKQIVEHRLKTSQQGVQIDVRTTPATISYIANVPEGFVIVIDKSGKPQVHQAKYESGADLERLLATVLSD